MVFIDRILAFVFIMICYSLHSDAIDLNCNFKLYTERTAHGYNCVVENQFIINNPNTTISNVYGRHMGYQKNRDVERLFFFGIKTMKFIPIGYSKFFKNINNIYIIDCPIEEIHAGEFENPSKLIILGLNSLKLTKIDPYTFKELVRLEELHIEMNEINEIGEETFHALENLKVLSLMRNRIKYLPSKLFERNIKLKEVRLNENKIQIVESEILKHLVNLKEINLRKNLCIDKDFPKDVIEIEEIENIFAIECENPLANKIQIYEKNIENLRNEVNASFKKLREKDSEMELMENENRNLSFVIQELKKEIAILRMNHSEMVENIKNALNDSFSRKISLQNCHENISKITIAQENSEIEIQTIYDDFIKLNESCEILNNKNDFLNSEIDDIRKNISSLKFAESEKVENIYDIESSELSWISNSKETTAVILIVVSLLSFLLGMLIVVSCDKMKSKSYILSEEAHIYEEPLEMNSKHMK